MSVRLDLRHIFRKLSMLNGLRNLIRFIKNKDKHFVNVYNVSNTRDVTKLMQRSDLMIGWPVSEYENTYKES